jgi:hypothetical protein
MPNLFATANHQRALCFGTSARLHMFMPACGVQAACSVSHTTMHIFMRLC